MAAVAAMWFDVNCNANAIQKLKRRPPHYMRLSILELQGQCSNCSREKQRSHRFSTSREKAQLNHHSMMSRILHSFILLINLYSCRCPSIAFSQIQLYGVSNSLNRQETESTLIDPSLTKSSKLKDAAITQPKLLRCDMRGV